MNDPVDDLLREAGERWRAGQPPPPEADTSRWRGRRHWVPLAAAATVIVVAVVAVYGFTRPVAEEPLPFGVGVAAPAGESLVLDDGDTVQASGKVIARPEGVKFCAPAPDFGLVRDDCVFSVPVTGVDLDRLTEPETVNGVVLGNAQLRGVWRNSALTVTEQTTPTSQTSPPEEMGPLPCAPPPGGWKPNDDADTKALHDYVVEANPDRFRRPWVSYPDGPPVGTTESMATARRVLVVEVVRGSVPDAGRELRARYDGNLCVADATGWKSLADQRDLRAKADQVLEPLMRDFTNGIYAVGGGDGVQVDLVALTPALAEKLKPISDGLELRPWLRPVS